MLFCLFVCLFVCEEGGDSCLEIERLATESQVKSRMLQQERPGIPVYGGQGPGGGVHSSLRILAAGPHQGHKKDGNFNFLGQEEDPAAGDENRNPVRPRALGPMGRDPPSSALYMPGPLSPLSRLPCWSPLEPLPEIESGDDGCGRVPPDGAEEGKMDEEMRSLSSSEKEGLHRGVGQKHQVEEDEEEEDAEPGLEWGDTDSEFEFSYRSGGSSSSLCSESRAPGDLGELGSVWDRVCVGGLTEEEPPPGSREKGAERRRKGSAGPGPGDDGSSDSDTDVPELMEAVWTIQDREKYKAQEMEKHHVQLTMYRRLALIRWVRTLQSRVQEQQNRLQSSFDVILTHRKELLRMGAAAAQ
ncbi:uncharacterized protein LOC114771703 isoform X1 [Denticeps clupeoides]|uniref:CA216 protein n=2 Tax=Denticeps clupeoides TaxID=299321 RepID=A0AAY4C2D3_9TELE|nr:uncharacterized protein LOC114771703 isoform X1 [Denticeps clupeoides]